MKMKLLAILAAAAAVFSSCAGQKTEKPAEKEETNPFADYPAFNADSAYEYVDRQVSFGPRIPGSEGSEKCHAYFLEAFRRFGADTIIDQRGTVTAFNGDQLPIRNVMARYNPERKKRVLVLAHWDTRPWADEDPHIELRQKTVPGANDGASGVGVILELARQINMKRPDVGVDFLLVDAEDYGNSGGFSDNADTWALGTQYFIKNSPYTKENQPVYAILLDMVGGTGAVFNREYLSTQKAPAVVDRVWKVAQQSGFSDRFKDEIGGGVTDDHVFLNEAGIPAIDIIECSNTVTRNFPPTWHTVDDDMRSIDRSSLKAAGQTVLNVLYSEPK